MINSYKSSIAVPPFALGLPTRFTGWRDDQWRAVERVLYSDKKFIAQAAPTGFGKSLAYVAAAVLRGGRTAILTSTRGLQSQLLADFQEIGMVDVRGMQNYPCLAATDFGLSPTTKCDDGPCHSGIFCGYKVGKEVSTGKTCEYYGAVAIAGRAELVVTNYSFWLHNRAYGEGIGQFDMLILDEAHDAPDELCSFLQVEIGEEEAEKVVQTTMLDQGATVQDWKEWAAYYYPKVEGRLFRMQEAMRERLRTSNREAAEMRTMKHVVKKLAQIAGMKGEWVVEWKGRKKVLLEPVWPAPYSALLFGGVKDKVVMFSATLRPKTAELLGIGEQDLEFVEWPSPFPIESRPVIHIPTTQVKFGMSIEAKRQWVRMIDNIIDKRLDRRGIIHTVSYERARWIQDNSRFGDIMISHSTITTSSAVSRYMSARPPVVLVSPSVTTGYDFPYEACEYQIISKVPFLDTRPPVMAARREQDPEYDAYIAAQTMVQECGRGMRAIDDRCECLVVDDNWIWFSKKYKKFFPLWFREGMKWARTIPAPLPKIRREAL